MITIHSRVTQTIKLIVTSPNASVDRPVFVSVRQLLGVTSWQIPFLDRRYVFVFAYIGVFMYNV